MKRIFKKSVKAAINFIHQVSFYVTFWTGMNPLRDFQLSFLIGCLKIRYLWFSYYKKQKGRMTVIQNSLQDAILQLPEALKDLYKDRLKAIILYGSVARGTALEESDVDILVLVDASQEELRTYSDGLNDISTDFALEFLKVFSIIDVSFQEFSEWKDVSPFYRNVTRDGVMLYAAL